MLEHPRMLVGLGDSGAHVGLIMDASLPTWFLAHWIRDREKFPIEEGIRRLTSDTADLFGIADRGRLVPGAHADVNVIDLDQLGLPLPDYVHDFPGGAGRYVQRSQRLPVHARERRGLRRRRRASGCACRRHAPQCCRARLIERHGHQAVICIRCPGKHRGRSRAG